MERKYKRLTVVGSAFIMVVYAHVVIDKIFSPERIEASRAFYQQGGLDSLFLVFRDFPWGECLVQALLQWAILGGVVLLSSWGRRPMEKLVAALLSLPRRRFTLLIFTAALAGSLFLFYFHYRFFPRSGDSGAFLFQAKILKKGALTVPSHPLREFFDSEYVINNGRAYAEYPIGTSFMLMLGDLFGMPWLIGPLLGALGLVFIYFSAIYLFDELIARCGALLILCAPVYFSMPPTYLSHAPQLFWLSLFIFCFLRTLDAKTVRKSYPLMAGVALGMAVNTRPLTSFTFSLPLFCRGLYLVIKDRRAYLHKVLYFSAGLLPFCGLLLMVNWIQNGSPLLFGHKVYNGPRPTMGFSGMYTLRQALSAYFFRLRLILFNLISPPLKAGVILVLMGLSCWHYRRSNSLLWAFFILTGLGYLTVVSSIWQTRYYYTATLYLLLLVPVGLYQLGNWLGEDFGKAGSESLLGSFLLLALISTLGVFCYHGTAPVEWLHTVKRPYLVAERHGLENALVFLRSTKLYYPKWYTRNSPDYNDSVLWVRDLGERNRELMGYYPERKAYLYDFERGDKAYHYRAGGGELIELTGEGGG